MPSIRYTVPALILAACAPGLLICIAELVGLGLFVFYLRFLLFLTLPLAALSGVGGLLMALFKKSRKEGLYVAIFIISFIGASVVSLKASNSARMLAFTWLAERSEPLVTVIKQFEADTGRPPANLNALIPTYLEEIPTTGMLSYPDYQYRLLPPTTPAQLHWYDLGSRDGEPMHGLWKHPDGDPEHAILVFLTDNSRTVLEARTDRLPASVPQHAFNSDTWAAQSNRMSMVEDAMYILDPVEANLSEIQDMLGPPDGRRFLNNANWELRVECSKFVLNWDVFFYWPTEDYPKLAHGGWVEPVGTWAYVHE